MCRSEIALNTQNDEVLGASNGFLAGEPRLGYRKVDPRFLSGSRGNQKFHFSTPEESSSVRGSALPIFLRPELPPNYNVTAVAVSQRQRLYSGVRMLTCFLV
jgi:hypothetical protein